MNKETSAPQTETVEEVAKKKKWYKNAWMWIAMVAVVVAATLAVCLLIRPKQTQLSKPLAACVEATLYAEHASGHTAGKYPTVAYTVLDVHDQGSTTTVYGVMLYREYTATAQNELKVWGASSGPFAITAKKSGDGYESVECWWPKDGAEYRTSIEKKFPKSCRDQAVNAHQYFANHDAICNADAMQNIPAEDKYTTLTSEKQNIQLAYQPSGTGSYIMAKDTFSADGSYVLAESKITFTFGDCHVVCTIEEDAYVYSQKESVNVPDTWVARGEVEYLKDGLVFYVDRTEKEVLGQWLLFSGISKEDYDKINAFEAYVGTDVAGAVDLSVGPTFTASALNWMVEEDLRGMFGNYTPSTFPFDTADVHYLPVRPIESRAQLDALIATYGNSWTDLTAENFAPFDEAFFADNFLMMTYYKSDTCSWTPRVASYNLVEDGASRWLSVHLELTKATSNSVGTTTDLTFTGKVKQVEGHAMLMECYEVGQFSQGVWVELGDIELDPQVGEEYVVTYEDRMMPSLPPRITAITVTPKE